MPRFNVSVPAEIKRRAEELKKLRGFQDESGLSGLFQTLIREEYERRWPPWLKPTPAKKVIQAAVEAASKPPPELQ